MGKREKEQRGRYKSSSLRYKNWDKRSLKERKESRRQNGVVNDATRSTLFLWLSSCPSVGPRLRKGWWQFDNFPLVLISVRPWKKGCLLSNLHQLGQDGAVDSTHYWLSLNSGSRKTKTNACHGRPRNLEGKMLRVLYGAAGCRGVLPLPSWSRLPHALGKRIIRYLMPG